jgi:hypothetical protein
MRSGAAPVTSSSLKKTRPSVGGRNPEIEQLRLAGAVGTDDGGHTLRRDREAHIVDCEHAVEAARELLDP